MYREHGVTTKQYRPPLSLLPSSVGEATYDLRSQGCIVSPMLEQCGRCTYQLASFCHCSWVHAISLYRYTYQGKCKIVLMALLVAEEILKKTFFQIWYKIVTLCQHTFIQVAWKYVDKESCVPASTRSCHFTVSYRNLLRYPKLKVCKHTPK